MVTLLFPKQNFACTEHQEGTTEKTHCEAIHQKKERAHDCCKPKDKHHQKDKEKAHTCSDQDGCCCSLMVSHSCLYAFLYFEFNIITPLSKEELTSMLVFHESTGHSSIFIPPKIA